MLVDRLLDVAVLALGVGEELHRHDVGVAVDDAAGQQRVALGELLRQALQARHEGPERQDVADDPEEQRDRQIEVGVGEQHERGERVEGGVPDAVQRLDDGGAERRRRLHDAAGDPAGEVVLEERQALARDVAVGLPAHQRGERRDDRLADDEVVEEVRGRAGDEDDEQHPGEQRAVLGEQPVRRGGAEDVHEVADIGEHRHLDEGDEEARQHEEREPRPGLADVVPVEGGEALRRRAVRGAAPVDAPLEKGEHGRRPESGGALARAMEGGGTGTRDGRRWGRRRVEAQVVAGECDGAVASRALRLAAPRSRIARGGGRRD